MAIFSTGSKTIDRLFAGGMRTKIPWILFGAPNLGKTWFCFQIASMCTRPVKSKGLNKKVLYLDTEGFFFTEDTVERFNSYFQKRWPDVNPDMIEIEHVPSIFTLGELFGITFEIHQEDKRFTVGAKFPTKRQRKLAKTAGRSKITSSVKLSDWMEHSELWERLQTKEYGLLIIDSLTTPIKSEIPTSTQNFPARTSLLQILLGACYPFSRENDVAILLTNHISMNPMSPGYQYGVGNPWGGQNVLYYIKHQFGLYRALKEDRSRYGPDGDRLRRIQRYRFPGLDKEIALVMLAKDKGYIDLPSPSSPVSAK